MEQEEEMEDPAKFCEYSDEEYKDLWCRHLKDDVGFLVYTNQTHRLDDYCYNVTSKVEECLTNNYTSSVVATCDEERYNLFMDLAKIPSCYRLHFMKMVSIVVPVVFALIIVAGTIGNGLVLFVVTFKQQMRNTTNILILNLAIADLLFVLVCLPPTAVSYVGDWPTGDIGCKLNQYLIPVAMYVSIYTLVLLSLDRYLAVVYPVKSISLRTGRNTGLAIFFVWIFTLSSCTPSLFLHHTLVVPMTGPSNRTICTFIGKNLDTNDTLPATDIKERYFQSIVFLTSLVIPLFAILALYVNMLLRLWKGSAALSHGPGPARDARNSGKNQENKKRVTRMIVAVIIVFAVCWTPLHIVLVLKAFGKYYDHLYEGLVILNILAQCLAYSNSCLNPLLYAFFSPNFRAAFVQALSRSSFRNGRDLNSRRKSGSQGKFLSSKDNALEGSGNLLDRRTSRPENNGPRISLEMIPLSSTNNTESKTRSTYVEDNQIKIIGLNDGMVHTEYIETSICNENSALIQDGEFVNASVAISVPQTHLCPNTS